MTDVETLKGTLAEVWRQLRLGVEDATAPARTLALATVGTDGSIFVTAGGVNPTSTIQALALYITDTMKKNLANLFD